MSYQVLARKWRPKNFSEIIGQEHVVRVLGNSLIQNRVHHAYLFIGTRGVGKTTIARVLAKSLNCNNRINIDSCCKCNTCLEIDSGKYIDLIEIDAASRTKVEDIRDLLENIQYLPTIGKYKIYIIDEVHMLSNNSFNALLKTLEEPPNHVKFLLATTEPQKIPITILSRCLQFNLKNISCEIIEKYLEHILICEKLSYEDNALSLLAIKANGSIRDALSLLDQAIGYCGKEICFEEIKSMLDIVDHIQILSMIEALANNDVKTISNIINIFSINSVNFVQLIDELLEVLYQISMIQLFPNFDGSKIWHIEKLKKLSKIITEEDVQLYYQIALIGKKDLFLAPNLQIGFEMIILRMMAFNHITIKDNIYDKNNDLKYKLNKNDNIEESLFCEEKDNNVDLLKQLNVTGSTYALLQHCTIAKNDKKEIELLLDPKQSSIFNKNHKERLEAAFSQYYNYPIRVTVKIGSNNMKTITNIEKDKEKIKQEEANSILKKDNKIQSLMTNFDAKIIENLLK